jgi:hypothetical protein
VSVTSSTEERVEVTVEGVLGRHLGQVLDPLPVVVCWLLLPVPAAVLHHFWPGPAMAALLAGCGCLVAAVSRYTSRSRTSALSMWLPPALTLAVFGWLAAICWLGFHSAEVGAWFTVGGSGCIAWNIWAHRTQRRPAENAIGASVELGRLFSSATQVAGVDGVKLIKGAVEDTRASGRLRMPGGKVPDELIKSAPQIESAMAARLPGGLPPGALQMTASPHDRRDVEWVLSDPRTLDHPIPWKGPSVPGGSIAQPVRWFTAQDGTRPPYRVTNHHLLAAGMTGAGKTYSLCYGEIAETVTRHDAAVIGFDITKGLQFLGVLEPALHAMVITPEHCLDMLARLHRARLARTNWLGRLRLGNWEEGCGLQHLTVWLEECPDIWELLDSDDAPDEALPDFLSDIKAARSAGMRIVLSLQRPTWDQMPTIAKEQLANICFGVKTSAAAKFGLSELQDDSDQCHPELWTTRFPGKFYIDAPSIPEEYALMACRADSWTTDQVAAHAAQYPASARPLDHITAPVLLGEPGVRCPVTVKIPESAKDLVKDHEEPETGLVWEQQPREQARLHSVPGQAADEPAEDDSVIGDEDLEDEDMRDDGGVLEVPGRLRGMRLPGDDEPEARLGTEESRLVLIGQISSWYRAGKTEFAYEDIVDAGVLDRTGRSRTWPYAELDLLEEQRKLRRIPGYPRKWRILDAA